MGEPATPIRASSPDTEAILEWKRATGLRKQLLLAQLLKAKSGLIRQLTMKAARAEKTAESTEDLFQAGCIGFMRALEGFDPSKGFAISTYAAWWIRHEVQRVARRAPNVALPRIRLRNEERERAVKALREDPDVEPESIGVTRSQLEAVRNSVGVRYISEAVERGSRAIERKLLANEDDFDAEGALDEARRYRTLEAIVARVRAGATAEELGLSRDAYDAALEVIAAEDEEPHAMPEEQNEAAAPPPKKRPGPKPGTPRKAAAKKANAHEKLRARLAELESEMKMLEVLLEAPPEAVARVLAAFAA